MIRNKKGQFIKGCTPWNKGLIGYMGANSGSFTSERVEQNVKYKLGEAQKPDRDGWLTCRIDEKRPILNKKTGKIYYHRRRVSYCRILLESHGIKVPKGYIVYHKDGNVKNNKLSNLEVISRAELIDRNLGRIRK